jgi:hypothetical protein
VFPIHLLRQRTIRTDQLISLPRITSSSATFAQRIGISRLSRFHKAVQKSIIPKSHFRHPNDVYDFENKVYSVAHYSHQIILQLFKILIPRVTILPSKRRHQKHLDHNCGDRERGRRLPQDDPHSQLLRRRGSTDITKRRSRPSHGLDVGTQTPKSAVSSRLDAGIRQRYTRTTKKKLKCH